MERLAVVAAACFMMVGMTAAVAAVGYLSYAAAATYVGLIVGLCLLFFVVVRTGVNRRFSDPYLTVPQLVAAGLVVSYGAYESAQARPVFIAMYLIAYMFGVFALDVRPLVRIALFYVACYGAVAALAVVVRPDLTDVRREIFRLVALSLILGWMTLLGRYISGLRHDLRRANEDLTRALMRAEEMANHDSLTGCHSRARMMELLAVEAKRARRGFPLTVCLVDLDDFKSINDDHGHLSGDEVLKQFVAAAQAELRATDFLARYGGDEFLIGLSQTPLDAGMIVAERIRRKVEDRRFPSVPPARRVTVSIGVVTHAASDPIDHTLFRADAALYEAKRCGRNSVVCGK